MTASGLIQTLRRVVMDLSSMGVDSALVGGLAVSVRSEPRFTRDIDLAVAVTDDVQAEATVRSLIGLGYELLATVEQDVTQRLATARLIPPGEDPEGVLLDLLFASSGIEGEVVAAADRLEVAEGTSVKVAATGDLIALKILSRDDETRPQDSMDLRLLLEQAGRSDIERARSALANIGQRGFHRGKQLQEELEEML